ncbi:hypothetical protein ACSFA0_23515 [Variovorax sp. LT1P1]|uniref:hypothetical protein n=1 Tax=Variovorax sp. LT1P1 TaxID=3443730 RepID=UPI003F46508A
MYTLGFVREYEPEGNVLDAITERGPRRAAGWMRSTVRLGMLNRSLVPDLSHAQALGDFDTTIRLKLFFDAQDPYDHEVVTALSKHPMRSRCDLVRHWLCIGAWLERGLAFEAPAIASLGPAVVMTPPGQAIVRAIQPTADATALPNRTSSVRRAPAPHRSDSREPAPEEGSDERPSNATIPPPSTLIGDMSVSAPTIIERVNRLPEAASSAGPPGALSSAFGAIFS